MTPDAHRVAARHILQAKLTPEEMAEEEAVIDKLAKSLRSHFNRLYPNMAPWGSIVGYTRVTSPYVELHPSVSRVRGHARFDLAPTPAEWRKGYYYDTAGKRYNLKGLKEFFQRQVEPLVPQPSVPFPAPTPPPKVSPSPPPVPSYTLRDLVEALGDALEKLGDGRRDPVRQEGGELAGAYRSSLPKEGASSWDDDERPGEAESWYEELVAAELRRARKELDWALRPYRSLYSSYDLQDDEKGWVSVYVKLKPGRAAAQVLTPAEVGAVLSEIQYDMVEYEARLKALLRRAKPGNAADGYLTELLHVMGRFQLSVVTTRDHLTQGDYPGGF